MHFLTAIIVLLTSTQALAAPLSLSFTDIEKRWSAGESDASIHASHNSRSASPSWPLISKRSASSEPDSHFASSYDDVTLSKREVSDSSALMNAIKNYASRLLRSKEEGLIAERSSAETEKAGMAPVLRPRKVRYRFSA